MIVIVETSFIIELVLQQEHAPACEELLTLCSSSGSARLAIPSFAVAEAGMALERNRGERRRFFRDDVTRHTSEIGSAQVLHRYRSILTQLEAELVQAESDEDTRWLEFRTAVLDKVEVIPLSGEMLDETITIQFGIQTAQFPDALVLASVRKYLTHVRAGGSDVRVMFVSPDGAAFGTSAVVRQLRDLGCTYINSFENAVRHLRHQSE